MKTVVASLLCALLLVVFPLTLVSAQEGGSISADLSENISVAYDLPYPGLLPDSPLYFVKVVRDSIIGFLIADSTKKAEFNLLQADKHLQAGQLLLDKKGAEKQSIAQDTLKKGERYFAEAIAKTEEAKKQDMDVADLAGRLVLSAKKHQEVYANILLTQDGALLPEITSLAKRMVGYEKEAAALGK